MIFVFKNMAFIAHRNITKVQIDENKCEVRISGLLNLLGEKEGNTKRKLVIQAETMQQITGLVDPFLSSLRLGYCFFMYGIDDGEIKCYSLYQDTSKQLYDDLAPS